MGRHNFVPPSSERTEFTSVDSLLDPAPQGTTLIDPEATQPVTRPRRARLGRRFDWFRAGRSVLRRADRFDLCLLGIIIAQPALSDPTHFMTWTVTGIMLVLWVTTLVRE